MNAIRSPRRWLMPVSWLYRAVIAARNARYDRGVGVARIDRPVISVGNITVGGTGKTPMVMWIVDALRKAGHQPVIAMRGYGARRGEESDEALEYQDRFGDEVPVIADPDRVSALRRFFSEQSNATFDCVVLDDGFQHRRLARDLDLVLIDATQNTFEDRLLPAGRLREPPERLRRTDAVIVTRCESPPDELIEKITHDHGRPPIATSQHVWRTITIHGKTCNTVTSSWLTGKKVVTMFGVAKPQAIELNLRRFDVEILDRISMPDHARYRTRDIATIRQRCTPPADAMLTTNKDWVKLRRLIHPADWPIPILVPDVRMEFNRGETQLRDRILNAAGKPAVPHGAESLVAG